jgi:hypothetical protein
MVSPLDAQSIASWIERNSAPEGATVWSAAVTGRTHALIKNRTANVTVLIKRDCGVMRRFFLGLPKTPSFIKK